MRRNMLEHYPTCWTQEFFEREARYLQNTLGTSPTASYIPHANIIKQLAGCLYTSQKQYSRTEAGETRHGQHLLCIESRRTRKAKNHLQREEGIETGKMDVQQKFAVTRRSCLVIELEKLLVPSDAVKKFERDLTMKKQCSSSARLKKVLQ